MMQILTDEQIAIVKEEQRKLLLKALRHTYTYYDGQDNEAFVDHKLLYFFYALTEGNIGLLGENYFNWADEEIRKEKIKKYEV